MVFKKNIIQIFIINYLNLINHIFYNNLDPEVFKDKKEHANNLWKNAYTFGGNKQYYDTTYQVNLCHMKNEDTV